MSPLDTDDWKLGAYVHWTPKRTPRCAPCSYCNGKGTIGGGFKDMDGERQCPECFGSGAGATIDPLSPEPPLPPGLVKHMRKAWEEFFAAGAANAGVRAAPLNGVPATLQHDEGAVAQCFYCRRYTLNPRALSDRPPPCECGKTEGWSGSFKKPGPDAEWSGLIQPTDGVPGMDNSTLIDAAEAHSDNYTGQDIPANEVRAAINNAFFAGAKFAGPESGSDR